MSKKRLDSWKAIAVFLDRSLRTVQRWHVCSGLPVHHFGGQKGSVFAYEEEIEQWLATFAEEPGAAQQRSDAVVEAGKRRSHELTESANSMWQMRSEKNIQAIAELYRGAIAEDSTNESAYAGLANALIFCALVDLMDGAMAYPSAVEALRQIPSRHSQPLGSACAAAWIDLLYNRSWRQARLGFEDAVSKHPTSFALSGLATLEVAEGNLIKAHKCAWEAWRLNPLAGSLGAFRCWIKYLSGDFQQVLDLAAQIRSGGGDSGFLTTVESLALIQCAPPSETLGHIEKAAANFPHNRTLQGVLGYATGVWGQKCQARRYYEQLAHCSETNRKSNSYGLAIACIGLGDRHEALDWLETAYTEGAIWSLGFRFDPLLGRFEGDPRFERLASKIGAPARYPGIAEIPGILKPSVLDQVLVGGHR